jgi:hypothetical protein
LVAPVPVDATGALGPTKREAEGKRWRQTSAGRHVPADVDHTHIEQRILEQAGRLRAYGAVTAWAALRWQGAAFFSGDDFQGSALPVPLVISTSHLRPDPRVTITQEQIAPDEITLEARVRCSTPQRALFDEVRRVGALSEREAVVAVDMVIAANLLTSASFAAYVATRASWTGVPVARRVAALAMDGSRSPQESRMRLVWTLDAELPPPLCNRPVYDLSGRLIGVPDLFDPIAGLVGEYDGGDHRRTERHRRDVVREHDFRDHGLEYLTVVGGELPHRELVAARIRAARARAPFLPPDRRRWTLAPVERRIA